MALRKGELQMEKNVLPDLESLINKRLSSGAYANAEDMLRRVRDEGRLARNAG
jgi:hypothetical protein